MMTPPPCWKQAASCWRLGWCCSCCACQLLDEVLPLVSCSWVFLYALYKCRTWFGHLDHCSYWSWAVRKELIRRVRNRSHGFSFTVDVLNNRTEATCGKDIGKCQLSPCGGIFASWNWWCRLLPGLPCWKGLQEESPKEHSVQHFPPPAQNKICCRKFCAVKSTPCPGIWPLLYSLLACVGETLVHTCITYTWACMYIDWLYYTQ